MFKIIPITKLSHEAIDCLINEGETFDGLTYLGVSPSPDEVLIDHDGDTFVVPNSLIVNTDLLTQDRMDLIDNLEADLDHPETNDYYNFMRSICEFNLSGDDSYFDYGNSFVTCIASELLTLTKGE